MTQIDLKVLKDAIDDPYASDCNHIVVLEAARSYLASQATPTDDLVLCRRVVKGDTTKYYDYIPVQDADPMIGQGEGQAETVGRTGGANPPTGAKVEVQASVAQTPLFTPLDELDMLETHFQGLLEGYANKMEWYAIEARTDNVLASFKSLRAALQRPSVNDLTCPENVLKKSENLNTSVNDDLIKSHDTLLSIAHGVQGYWTTSNDCLDSQACVDEAIANAEKLKERLDK